MLPACWLLTDTSASLQSHVSNHAGWPRSFVGVGNLFLIVVIYSAGVLINFLACIWYFVATVEGQDNSWLSSVGANHVSMTDQSTPRQWVAAVYWTTATILTVGYVCGPSA